MIEFEQYGGSVIVGVIVLLGQIIIARMHQPKTMAEAAQLNANADMTQARANSVELDNFSRYQETLIALQTSVLTLTNKNAEMEQKLAAKDARLADVEKRLADKDKELVQIEAKYQVLEQQYRDIERKFTLEKADRIRLQDELNKYQISLSVERESREKLERDVEALRTRLNEVTRERDELKQQVALREVGESSPEGEKPSTDKSEESPDVQA